MYRVAVRIARAAHTFQAISPDDDLDRRPELVRFVFVAVVVARHRCAHVGNILLLMHAVLLTSSKSNQLADKRNEKPEWKSCTTTSLLNTLHGISGSSPELDLLFTDIIRATEHRETRSFDIRERLAVAERRASLSLGASEWFLVANGSSTEHRSHFFSVLARLCTYVYRVLVKP